MADRLHVEFGLAVSDGRMEVGEVGNMAALGPGAGVALALVAGEEARKELGDKGTDAREAGADNGDVAFNGGPLGSAWVII